MIRAFGALCLLLPSALAAQAVELRLLEEGNRAPIAGAIVRLLGDKGAVAQGLSNAVGRIVLRAPAAGSYRLKVDRIGWSGTITAPFELAEGETVRRELEMAAQRTELPELVVRGKSECDSEIQGGTLAAVLWEEIRKALTANVITQRSKAVPLHLREFVRELDGKERPQREWVVTSTLMRGQPFGTLPPAALAEYGFVQLEPNAATYAAPDAVLLLSDEFVATHCFRAVPGPGALVGLAFEPVQGRKVVEVKGTLWVDRTNSELKFLEYNYVGGFEGDLRRANLGGRVELQRLPTGPWIISYWHIRMPRLDSAEVRGTGNTHQTIIRLTGYQDHGGRAEVAVDSLGIVDRALVTGQVYDSSTGRGLEGAVLSVRGYRDSVLSDSAGRFVLAVRASGDQTVTATHAKLGLLGEATSHAVLLSLGDSTAVQFAVPPLAAFVKKLCGSTPSGQSGLVGIKWGANGQPAEGLGVRLKWRTASGGTKEERSRDGPRGLYAVCDLPADRPLPAQLLEGIQPVMEQSVRLEYGKFSWVDLRAPGAPQ
jgi:hypothetical protein